MAKPFWTFPLAILLSMAAQQVVAVPYTEYGVMIWNEYQEAPSIVVPQSALGPEVDSPNAVTTALVCIDAYTQMLLNCPYQYWLKGVDLGNDTQVATEISPPLTHIEI